MSQYKVIILSYQHGFRMRVDGRCVSVPTESDKRYWVDKIVSLCTYY